MSTRDRSRHEQLLDALEPRQLLATYWVDTTVDEDRDERSNAVETNDSEAEWWLAGTGTKDFVSRFRTQESNGCDDAIETSPYCHFDDRVIAVSVSQVTIALTSVGKLSD